MLGNSGLFKIETKIKKENPTAKLSFLFLFMTAIFLLQSVSEGVKSLFEFSSFKIIFSFL
ncbi:hypothetical protein B5F34_02475 [Mediterranea sp. An20]|nr:hypothetical protein B5F34_02475 [Mediterranea sp. An20]